MNENENDDEDDDDHGGGGPVSDPLPLTKNRPHVSLPKNKSTINNKHTRRLSLDLSRGSCLKLWTLPCLLQGLNTLHTR